jgi:hypothetical protein
VSRSVALFGGTASGKPFTGGRRSPKGPSSRSLFDPLEGLFFVLVLALALASRFVAVEA